MVWYDLAHPQVTLGSLLLAQGRRRPASQALCIIFQTSLELTNTLDITGAVSAVLFTTMYLQSAANVDLVVGQQLLRDRAPHSVAVHMRHVLRYRRNGRHRQS